MNQIFSRAMPVARAGVDVTITPTQTLGDTTTSPLLELSGPDDIHVRIDGPQTSLTADLIAGVYPAPGSETSPDEYLPHIALNRRTLPWERQGPNPARTVPWLALLVFSEADFTFKSAGQRRKPGTLSVEQTTVTDSPRARRARTS